MSFYIVKYALSKGIQIEEGEISERGYLKVPGDYSLYGENDYATSMEQALKMAEAKRVKKIFSLQKQIDKLSKKVF